jgi:broad specificity phosphatase PhoE
LATYGHHSKVEAAERLGYLLPENDVAHGLLRALGSAIRIAHEIGPKMWSVTLTDRLVRLNFGPVEVLLIFGNRASFAVRGPVVRKPRVVRREPAEHARLAGSDWLVGAHVVMGEMFDEYADQFRAAIEAVRALFPNSDSFLNAAAKGAHARGLLEHLEERLDIRLPRPGWDDEHSARPETAALFEEAVFTAMDPSLFATGTSGAIDRPRTRWSRALRSLEASRKANTRMPILIGDATHSVVTLVAWGLVVDIDIDDERTRVEYEALTPLVGHSATELRKLSDGEPISEDYQRAYVPCVTPDFLHDVHDAPFAEDVRDVASVEGRRRLITHFRIERQRSIVDAAKAAWARADPWLRCEVCGFSAEATYGTAYVEAHHRTPLGDLDGRTTTTTIADLACVCANCHRALHREPNLLLDELAARVRDRALGPDSRRTSIGQRIVGGERD